MKNNRIRIIAMSVLLIGASCQKEELIDQMPEAN